MEQEGFEPAVEGTELTLRNCPFDALAQRAAGARLRRQPRLRERRARGARVRPACEHGSSPEPDRCCVRVGHDDDHEQRSRRTTDRAGSDHDAWEGLFHAYRTFYEYDEEQDVVDRVWGWINDDAHEANALVALVGRRGGRLRPPPGVRAPVVGQARALPRRPVHPPRHAREGRRPGADRRGWARWPPNAA